MKKTLIVFCMAAAFISCGKAKSGASLAKDVCDCYSRANSMDAADPGRAASQDECLKKQGEAWNKIKDDPKKMDEFNKAVGECSKAMIRKSLGQ